MEEVTQGLPQLVDHLFRREAGKMVAYLSRFFGLSRLDLAEDVVQDTLCRAMETWPVHGIPEEPSAWLMRAARNRAIDLLRRDEHLRYILPEFTQLLKHNEVHAETATFEREIQDDQLRMIFACCHPELSVDSQIPLILKTLCGFSVTEIAHALLASEDSIEKRLGRARKLFRSSERWREEDALPNISERIESVYQAIYLLFNEGYHGNGPAPTVREDLCFEAIRLALLLAGHPAGGTPKTHALVALLCFHAARLNSRIDDDGVLIQLKAQDRAKWDRQTIGRGFHYLEKASVGDDLSEYHVEAAIASLHCSAPTYEATDWDHIVDLYEVLYRLKPSPIVALNRAIAFGQAKGPTAGLTELDNLSESAKLKNYPFLPAASGEFLLAAGRPGEAASYFESAMKLARSQAEANFFASKLSASRIAATR